MYTFPTSSPLSLLREFSSSFGVPLAQEVPPPTTPFVRVMGTRLNQHHWDSSGNQNFELRDIELRSDGNTQTR